MSKRLLTALVAVALVAPSVFAGTVFTATTTSEGKKGAEQQNSTVKGWVSGDSSKIEFIQSGNPMLAKGGYLLTRDAGKNAYLVNPKDKTYMKWDIEGMGQMLGGMGKMMSIKVTDPKVEKIAEDPGEVIVGLPTVHYRYRTSYTMTVTVFGRESKQQVVADDDIWTAPKLVEMALGMWLRKNPPSMGDENFDKLVKAEMSKSTGFPLKKKTVRTATDEKGKTEVTTTTMEVTSLDTGAAVPDSTFEMPPDYKETSMFGEGGEDNPLAKMFGGKKK